MSDVPDEKTGNIRERAWATLAQTLVDRFPLILAGEVVEIITRNRHAVEAFGLAETERLPIVEVMTRHQLMQLTEQVPDSIRSEPEQGLRRDPHSERGA
jgi:hypothetical protein